MKILIVNNPNNAVAVELRQKIKKLFLSQGDFCDVLTADEWINNDYDYAVSVGGDGTLLHAAYLLMNREIPIVGVNVGRLGFLTALTADNYKQLLKLKTKEYYREDRLMLSAEFGDKKVAALNEILVAGASIAKTVDVEVYCDNTLVFGYRGDGVIISTPTGSTAYALSAGGPIVDSALGAISVTPLSAHGLGTPPMVFSRDRIINVKVATGTGGVKLCADGKDEYTLQDTVTISSSDRCTPLIFFSKTGQFSAIDDKLRRK